jgi:hypothetical protein
VTTRPASGTTTSSAVLNGYLEGLGESDSVTVSFEWWENGSETIHETPAEEMTAPGDFSYAIDSLEPKDLHFLSLLWEKRPLRRG